MVHGRAGVGALGVLDVDLLARLHVLGLALGREAAREARHELLAAARVERRVHDRSEAADDDRHRGEDHQVGRDAGPLEARVFDALQLIVPARGREQVENAHEHVDASEEQRQRQLSEPDDQEVEAHVDQRHDDSRLE